MRIVFLLSIPTLALATEPLEDLDAFHDVPGFDEEDFDPIINGEDANIDEWPMAGGLLASGTGTLGPIELDGRLLMCSSTLIAPDVVLSAAHCVDLAGILDQAGIPGLTIADLEFAWSRQTDLSMYQFSLTGPEPYPDDVVLVHDYVHPDAWDIGQLQMGLHKNNDISLLFLDEAVEGVPFGVIITEEEDDAFEVGVDVEIVGWGQQTDAQAAPEGTVGLKQMGTSWVSLNAKAEFKVGEEVDDVRKCHGDSGGPSFFEVETDSSTPWRVVGVTSHSYDLSDCRETGGVDTRVSAYLDWIEDEMRARCDDGSRVWCDIEGILPPPNAEGEIIDDDGNVVWDKEGPVEVAATSTPDEDEAKACGCASGTSPLSGVWLLLALPLLRRRIR
ncbi:MAG: trypsin-like serine protease [Proteobacteria bacterium]|jgi:hypothetical protein|nr:trypsin-like serine protease [Pseudomonadota bacterium]